MLHGYLSLVLQYKRIPIYIPVGEASILMLSCETSFDILVSGLVLK